MGIPDLEGRPCGLGEAISQLARGGCLIYETGCLLPTRKANGERTYHVVIRKLPKTDKKRVALLMPMK
jgi:hypothetical protein